MADGSWLSKFDSARFGKMLASLVFAGFVVLLLEGIILQSRDEGRCGHRIGDWVKNDLKSEVVLGIGDSFCVEPATVTQSVAPPSKMATPVTAAAPVTPRVLSSITPASSAAPNPAYEEAFKKFSQDYRALQPKDAAVQITDAELRSRFDRKWQCSMPSGRLAQGDHILPAACANWTLFINGQEVAKGEKIDLANEIDPATASPDEQRRVLFRFSLPRTVDTADSKSSMIRAIWSGGTSGYSPVNEASVSLCSTDEPLPGYAKKCVALPNAKLRIYHLLMLATGAVLLGLFGAGLLWMCRNTGIIRDPGNGTYSLARTQVMYWFALVTAGFVFIYMSTGQYIGVITVETLGLLGIYSATGWYAASRSAPMVDPKTHKIGPSAPAKGAFLAGLLSDGTTDSPSEFGLHRLITIIWSIILGAIMAQWVIGEKIFPDFDSSQLALAGLTSGFFAMMKPDVNKPAK